MKYLLLGILILLLTGCSSFHLGGVVYCPFGAACTFQMVTPAVPSPPSPSASGVGA